MTTTKPQRLPLLTTLLSGAALAGLMSTPAIAQDTNADEEIVVTATGALRIFLMSPTISVR